MTKVRVRGQIAIGLMVLSAFMLILVGYLVKLGQMAEVRVETSNASDAGALAAASWIVSGQNEAALMTEKMIEAIEMVQAIYLQEFCPGEEPRQYANALWNSLWNNYDPELPIDAVCEQQRILGQPGTYEFAACGPTDYFRLLANGVMEASWNMGRREFLTASVNNMLMRFSGGDSVQSLDAAAMANELREVQILLQTRTWDGSMPPRIDSLHWHNGRIDPDTGFPLEGYIYHRPVYSLENYPNRPPKLQMQNLRLSYLQYQAGWDPDDDVDDDLKDAIGCNNLGFGIRNSGPLGSNPGPLAQLDIDNLPEFPLEVVQDPDLPRVGRKRWESEVNMREIIPGLCPPCEGTVEECAGWCVDNIDVGTCEQTVCGELQIRFTDLAPVLPLRIVRMDSDDDPKPFMGTLEEPPLYEGDIRVRVSHEAYKAKTGERRACGDFIDNPDFPCEGFIPVLKDIADMPAVESSAVGHYESAGRHDDDPECPFCPLRPNAEAYLIDVE